MKKIFIKLMFVVGILSFACGCSSDTDENIESRSIDINELVLDENTGDKWNGTGLPSWLKDRFSNYVIKETHWGAESYSGVTLCNVYKHHYEDNLLLVLHYERFGYRGTSYYNESNTLCFTDDGRRVKFEGIKEKFDEKAEPIYTNELGSKEYRIKVEDSALSNVKSLGWLQEVINQICEKVKEPEQVLNKVAFGYAHSDTETYVVVDYEYFDKSNLADGEIRVYNVYTTDGKKIEISKKLKTEELCEQRITSLWAIF